MDTRCYTVHAGAVVFEVAEYLIENGAGVSARDKEHGATSLHHAVQQEGYIEVVRLPIKNGACVDAKNDYGRTPLHRSCRYCRMEITKLLCENGADVEAEDNEGGTPIHWACDGIELETVKFLIENGVDNVNVKDKKGWTPLHWTCVLLPKIQ